MRIQLGVKSFFIYIKMLDIFRFIFNRIIRMTESVLVERERVNSGLRLNRVDCMSDVRIVNSEVITELLI